MLLNAGWIAALAGLSICPAGNRHVTILASAGEDMAINDHAWCKNRGRTRGMTLRVLAVDDEPDIEPLFRQQFRREVREGLYSLDFALSGETALSLLDACVGEEIILVVSEINMPRMSGLDLLPKAKERKPALPVFVTSASRDANTVTVALECGADEFLTKPVEFQWLRRDIMAVQADAMRRDA